MGELDLFIPTTQSEFRPIIDAALYRIAFGQCLVAS